jgi:hypothetical protein
MQLSPSNVGLGFTPQNDDVTMRNATGSALPAGSILALDFEMTQGASNAIVGDRNSVFATGVLPYAGSHSNNLFRNYYVVTLEDCAAGALVKCRARGIAMVRCTGSADIAGQFGFTANGASTLTLSIGATTLATAAIATTLEPKVGASEELLRCLFDGFDGLKK